MKNFTGSSKGDGFGGFYHSYYIVVTDLATPILDGN